MEFKNRVAIVLVGTQSPGNIGMVSRAMKNMGLSDLRLVNPCRVDHPEAFKFAVAAKDVLLGATIYTSLEEALAGCEFSVATTRRHGKYRQEINTPEEVVARFAAQPPESRIALVFGREDNGLTTEEVSRCRWQATIPTADDFGSLNLSQAVLLFCYVFFNGMVTVPQAAVVRDLADTRALEDLYGHMEQALLRIGFLNPQNPAHLMRTLRRIYARAELDVREVAVLRGMMSQIDWAAAEFKGKKGDLI
jgi:tRNA/rRNA methyltransferase